MVRLKSGQVAAAGEHLVAAEVHRRGGWAVTFAGNMPGIDLLASDAEHERKITIQVKTRTAGDWQTSIDKGRAWANDPLDGRFWVLVDLRHEQPAYFVMPAYWIENDIYESHHAWLRGKGGRRPGNPDSKHHRITTARVDGWRDRWDVLAILD